MLLGLGFRHVREQEMARGPGKNAMWSYAPWEFSSPDRFVTLAGSYLMIGHKDRMRTYQAMVANALKPKVHTSGELSTSVPTPGQRPIESYVTVEQKEVVIMGKDGYNPVSGGI
jgi:hypothetical protein